MSGHGPAGNGPSHQIISPVWMFTAISCLKPALLNLCDHHFWSNGIGSFITKSVPSRLAKTFKPMSFQN